MKLKFLATGISPDSYTIEGETITAHHGQHSEAIDLSSLEHGDKFEGLEPETLTLPGGQILRDAFRDEGGELHLTLCQAAGPGDWTESQVIDASEFVSGRKYIRKVVNGEPVENIYPVEDFDAED